MVCIVLHQGPSVTTAKPHGPETQDKELRTWRVSASISDRRLRRPSWRTPRELSRSSYSSPRVFQRGSGRAGALCARLRGLRGGGDAGGRHRVRPCGHAGGILSRCAFRGGLGRGNHRRRGEWRSVAFRNGIDVAVCGWPARLSPCGLTCAFRGRIRRLHLFAGRSQGSGAPVTVISFDR